jgi:hypothetical protein
MQILLVPVLVTFFIGLCVKSSQHFNDVFCKERETKLTMIARALRPFETSRLVKSQTQMKKFQYYKECVLDK